MERFFYLQRHGFDPTDCDNADNYYHPSDPLGPGPSIFGRQHQRQPTPRRPIPTDPFEAFRFFNRLQGLNERECTERHAFQYINRPRPANVERTLKHFHFDRKFQQKCRKRKHKVECPDVIESFEGDEISNLFFYHPLHEAMKKHPVLSFLLGFEIVPGLPPPDSVEVSPSSLPELFVLPADVDCAPTESNLTDENLEMEFDRESTSGHREYLLRDCSTICEHDTEKPIEEKSGADSSLTFRNPPQDSQHLVSDVKRGGKYLDTTAGFSSDIKYVARISMVRSERLSTIIDELLISMKGFIRLGVSLVKRDMEVVSQSDAMVNILLLVVTEFVSFIPLI